MKINKIAISGLRAFNEAQFIFQPGMNLLGGVNGVGKTTVLEAVRICLTKLMPEITLTKSRKDDIIGSDIKIGSEALQVSCDFVVDSVQFNLLIQKTRVRVIGKESGMPR